MGGVDVAIEWGLPWDRDPVVGGGRFSPHGSRLKTLMIYELSSRKTTTQNHLY